MDATVVVIPCYNEAERLDADAFAAYSGCASFLFVDDGSTDDTATVLTKLCERAPERMRMESLATNSGKSEAVRVGVSQALGTGAEFVGYWDSDLATPLATIDRFHTELIEAPRLEAVIGSRVRRLGADVERSALRHYPGRVFATAASMLLDLPVYDTQCGAKLFRAGALTTDVFSEPFLSRWVFDVEILARYAASLRAGGADPQSAILEYPLDRWHDVPGSKLGIRDAARAVADLWAIHRRGSRERKRGSA